MDAEQAWLWLIPRDGPSITLGNSSLAFEVAGMPYIAVAETADDNRARFLAETLEEAIIELGTQYPVGKSVQDRLRKGERVVTDGYTLAVLPLAASPPKKQQTLF